MGCSLQQLSRWYGGTGRCTSTSGRDVLEEDRAFLEAVSGKTVFEFVPAPADRPKYTIWSEPADEFQDAFSPKPVTALGDEPAARSSRDGIGFACRKGLKYGSPNQDSFLIMKVENEYSLYGVFDGHGRRGHDVSNFVKEHLPKVLFSSDDLRVAPMQALADAFEKTQGLLHTATSLNLVDAVRSGTTCSVVLHVHRQNMLYVAHVGDSRVVLGHNAIGSEDAQSEKKAWKSADLTIDHKPDLPEERQRIEAAGGSVVHDGFANYRVYARGKDLAGKRYPGLNMSRSMGDLGATAAGVCATPDVQRWRVKGDMARSKTLVKNGTASRVPSERATFSSERATFTSERAPGGSSMTGINIARITSNPSVSSHSIDPLSDKFVLLCSDGVWEFVTSQQAVEVVGRLPNTEAVAAAELLASLAWDRWMVAMEGQVADDITAIVVHLAPPADKQSEPPPSAGYHDFFV